MTEPITLSRASLRCEIKPELGGCIAGFRLGEIAVLRSIPARDLVAIEPVSHVNNAMNLMDAGAAPADDLGIRVLLPGESMSARMSIQVEAVQ